MDCLYHEWVRDDPEEGGDLHCAWCGLKPYAVQKDGTKECLGKKLQKVSEK